MFRCNLTFNEGENFLIPLSITFLNPKNLGLLFAKNSLTWAVKCEKLNVRKSHEWNSHLEIFSLPQEMENSSQNLLLRTDILQKTVVGCLEYCNKETWSSR